MNRARLAASMLLLVPAAPIVAEEDSASRLEAIAARLYESLSPDLRREACLEFDSRERGEMKFPGGPRAGVQLGRLSPEEREACLELVKTFCSEYGREKCELVAAQDQEGSLDRFYLAFFGVPAAGGTYAWRIAEHHLTLVHVEVARGEPVKIGPILLGANPPTLWEEEEDAMIALYEALSPDERRRVAGEGGKGTSSREIGDLEGARIGDLGEIAASHARKVLESRLRFFSSGIRSRIEAVLAAKGGIESARLVVWGEPTSRCSDGGRWDLKIGLPGFLMDYENTRGHIHMSLVGTLASAE